MRPLTDHTPKPLLTVAGKPLIIWQMEALMAAGFRDFIINTAWLGGQIVQAIGDGAHFGVPSLRVRYSHEGMQEEDALETRGGVVKALPMLEPSPFLTVSADIFTDYDYARLLVPLAAIARGEIDGHFVLADNPEFHPQGDFAIRDGFATRHGTPENPRLNYGGITCWHPKLFRGLPLVKERLFPWADSFVAANRVGAEYFGGVWENVGTPEQLDALDRTLRDTRHHRQSHTPKATQR